MKYVLGTLFWVLSFSVFAGSQQIPRDRKITSLSVYDNLVFVTFEPGYTNSQGCPKGGNSMLSIDLNTDGDLGENIYAAALAAATSGKKVGFGISGCFSERPKIYRIDVQF